MGDSIGAGQACPKYLRACVAEGRHGGSNSYAVAGWRLAIHLATELYGYDDESDELAEERLREVAGLLEADASDEELVSWFKRRLPRCIALVPRRRHASFLKGVREAWEADRMY